MSSASAGRLLIRSALVRKRASASHSGAPSTRTSRSQFAWLAPPIVSQPSAAAERLVGRRRWCAEPPGPGASPVAKMADCQ